MATESLSLFVNRIMMRLPFSDRFLTKHRTLSIQSKGVKNICKLYYIYVGTPVDRDEKESENGKLKEKICFFQNSFLIKFAKNLKLKKLEKWAFILALIVG